jgi:uncharacterized iron-regulated protein
VRNQGLVQQAGRELSPQQGGARARAATRREALAHAAWLLGVGTVGLPGLPGLGGCAPAPGSSAGAGMPAGAPWEQRLRGQAVVLMGERHDNAEHHRLRLAVIERALQAGWRPALLMEMFDIERQPDLQRARAQRPNDAAYLVAQAATPGAGWDWRHYTPLVELALRHGLPLVAANLSRAQAQAVMQQGAVSALGAERARRLGLQAVLSPQLVAAQEQEIDLGHCGQLPASMVGRMARAQLARDAVMAERVAEHAGGGVLLLAGNGHVRRDLGVPRWLKAELLLRAWVVGYLEPGEARGGALYDAEVLAPAGRDHDPCDSLRPREPGPRG